MTRHSPRVYLVVDPVQDYEESLAILGVHGSLAAAKMATRRYRRTHWRYQHGDAWQGTKIQLWQGDQVQGTWTFDPRTGCWTYSPPEHAVSDCTNCGRQPEPGEGHNVSVSDGGEGAMLVCLDPEGYELIHEDQRCTCHGRYVCPDPPDPPF